MDQEAFFWKIQQGLLPVPQAMQTLGGKIVAVDGLQGTIETVFDGRAEFTNPAGTIQGGFLAAMLDDTMGPALAATLSQGEFAPTLNLNISFEKAAKVGVIEGRGRVLQRGKDVCFLSGELYQAGELIASSTATALIRSLPA